MPEVYPVHAVVFLISCANENLLKPEREREREKEHVSTSLGDSLEWLNNTADVDSHAFSH